MRRLEPYFPLSRGVPRVNDRQIISGIIFVIRNCLGWRDAPADYGRPKTIYNRFIRRSRLGVFNKLFERLEEVCCVTGWWRHCNRLRPHNSLVCRPPVPETIKESEAVQAIKPSILTAATVQPLLPVKDTSAWLVGGATEKRDSVKGTWAWHLLGHRVCNG